MYFFTVAAQTMIGRLPNMNAEDSNMTDRTNRGNACTPNTSIHCSVTDCAYHCQEAQYCGLNAIQVGTHESNPAMDQCTDCQSFEKLS